MIFENRGTWRYEIRVKFTTIENVKSHNLLCYIDITKAKSMYIHIIHEVTGGSVKFWVNRIVNANANNNC